MNATATPLSAADREALARESWIDAATVDAWGIHRVSSTEGAVLVGRTDREDYKGMVFPIYWPGEARPRECFLRRDHPPMEQHNGKMKPKAKYLAPPGRGNRLLFGPDESVDALTDTALPVLLVEGVKKTLAAWRFSRHEEGSPRVLVCGISGVWGWRGTIGKAPDASGVRVDVKGVIADIDRVTWTGRTVTVLFDSDSRLNEKVLAARRGLAAELRRRGAHVTAPDLPALDGLDKTGFDDLLAAWGPDRVREWLARPPEAGPRYTPSADTAQVHTPPVLARTPNILAAFEQAVRLCGVVGEERCAKVLYLALTSRLLNEPVSLVIKGLSSSGKSFTTETTLKFFPKAAYLSMTAMSERALVYMKEDFKHKTLVIFEAVALREQREKNESNLTAYFVRSLLSEGRISYPVTVRDKDGGFITKTIVKEGPTNVILTTTATELHGENETRLLSLPTNDSREQTKAVMRQLAKGPSEKFDCAEWHTLQEWLATAEHRVTIPYAAHLAEAVPPVAVRLRRDFRSILRLIEAHAILHQRTRERDEDGRIIATEADYLAVRALVADLVASGVGATVPGTMRDTVQAVQHLNLEDGATVRQVAHELKLDRSATQRRIQGARERGYLVNLEEKRGRPARYVIGDPLPDEVELLPQDVPDGGVQHSTPGTHSPEKSVSPSDAEPFEGGVQVCNDNGEIKNDDAEEVIDLAR